MRQKEETGAVPFVLQGHPLSTYLRCKLSVARASANKVYQPVSRGGQPVVLVIETTKPSPLLTIDQVITELEKVQSEHGPDVPFLASRGREFELCDIWPSLAGASNVFKSASRGGQRVANVAFFAPDK